MAPPLQVEGRPAAILARDFLPADACQGVPIGSQASGRRPFLCASLLLVVGLEELAGHPRFPRRRRLGAEPTGRFRLPAERSKAVARDHLRRAARRQKLFRKLPNRHQGSKPPDLFRPNLADGSKDPLRRSVHLQGVNLMKVVFGQEFVEAKKIPAAARRVLIPRNRRGRTAARKPTPPAASPA